MALSDLLVSKKKDVLAATKRETVACVAEISPPGYMFYHQLRGGGYFCCQNISKLLNIPPSIESRCVEITNSSFSNHFICLYEVCYPPRGKANFF